METECEPVKENVSFTVFHLLRVDLRDNLVIILIPGQVYVVESICCVVASCQYTTT